MTYSKNNSENNAICGLDFWFNETALIFFWSWNFNRFSTSNFIVEIITIDPTDNDKVIARENIFCTSRSGNQFNVWVIGNRAFEPVPIDDDQTSNIQQALPFVKTNTIIRQVSSKALLDKIQDWIITLETDKLDISTYNQEKNVFSASSEWTDTYKITDSSLTSYNDWQPIRFRCDVANTWSATLEINALWTKSLKKQQGTEDLETWDILANWIVTAIYNSTLDVFQYSSQLATLVTVWSATESIEWVAELTTQAELTTWTDDTKIVTPLKIEVDSQVSSWNYELAVQNTDIETWPWSYTKIKDIEVSRKWTYSVSFNIRHNNWGALIYWRIYVNWIAVWIERSTTSTSFILYTEDISINDWDNIQLYIKVWSWVWGHTQLFTIDFLPTRYQVAWNVIL